LQGALKLQKISEQLEATQELLAAQQKLCNQTEVRKILKLLATNFKEQQNPVIRSGFANFQS